MVTSMEGFEKVINTAEKGAKLLSKLNYGLGSFPGFSGKKQDEEQAIQFWIDSIKNDDSLSYSIKAARIANARQILKDFINQNAIVEIAVSQLNDQNQAEKLGDDWLSHFMDAAKHVYDEKIQQLWGKILAGECNAPGSFPKTLIQTLSFLTPSLAEYFQKICSFTLREDDLSPRPLIDADLLLSSDFPSLDIFWELERHGLIFFEKITNYIIIQDSISLTDEKGNIYGFSASKTEPDRIAVGNVLFTQDGKALYSVLSVPLADDFDHYIEKFAEKHSLVLNRQRVERKKSASTAK